MLGASDGRGVDYCHFIKAMRFKHYCKEGFVVELVSIQSDDS